MHFWLALGLAACAATALLGACDSPQFSKTMDVLDDVITRTRCANGNAAECTNLGFIHEHRDPEEALAFFRDACQATESRGCEGLGDMLLAGRGGTVDEPKAAEAFRTACNGNQGKACLKIARMYEAGTGVTKDHAEAVRYLRMACDHWANDACVGLGELFETGELTEAEGVGFFLRACGQSNGKACFELGRLYDDGKLVPKERTLAKVLFDRACDHGTDEGCLRVGKPVPRCKGGAQSW